MECKKLFQAALLFVIGYVLVVRTKISHSGRSVKVELDYKLPQFINDTLAKTLAKPKLSSYEKRKAIMARGCSILPSIQAKGFFIDNETIFCQLIVIIVSTFA